MNMSSPVDPGITVVNATNAQLRAELEYRNAAREEGIPFIAAQLASARAEIAAMRDSADLLFLSPYAPSESAVRRALHPDPDLIKSFEEKKPVMTKMEQSLISFLPAAGKP